MAPYFLYHQKSLGQPDLQKLEDGHPDYEYLGFFEDVPCEIIGRPSYILFDWHTGTYFQADDEGLFEIR